MFLALIQATAVLGSLFAPFSEMHRVHPSFHSSSKHKTRSVSSKKRLQYTKKVQFTIREKTKKAHAKEIVPQDVQEKNELEKKELENSVPASFAAALPDEVVIQNKESQGTSVELLYGRFPKETLKLSELKQRSEELKANNWKESERLMKQIRKQFQRHLDHLENKGRAHNFDMNLSCLQIPNRLAEDPIINASDVTLNGRNYLLFGCPWRADHATVLFDVALKQGVSLFVSTLESTDAQDKFNNYWLNDKLIHLRSRDGWTITNIGQRVLAKAEMEPQGTNEPQIIESTLLATRAGESRTLIHLHYEGWRDRQAMPSEALFNVFQDRIAELQKGKTVPFAINCHGGVGRTGTTALSHYFRHYVDAELAAGKNLDDIEVNIPEVLFQFRLQRKWFLGESGQLANAYSVLGDYYEQLKKKKLVTEDTPFSPVPLSDALFSNDMNLEFVDVSLLL